MITFSSQVVKDHGMAENSKKKIEIFDNGFFYICIQSDASLHGQGSACTQAWPPA